MKNHNIKISGIFTLAVFVIAGTAALSHAVDDRIYGTQVIEEEKKNFLWKVTSDNGTAYLHGSIHLGKPSMFPLDSAIETAFDKSSLLVVEVNIDAIDPMVVQQIMMQKGTYLNGDRLENNISRSTAKQLSNHLSKYGMSIEYFSGFKPWFVSLTLSVLQIKLLGFDEEYGIDKYFLRSAVQEGKEILELETMEYQFGLFEEIDQDLFLQYTLESLNETELMLDQLIAGWKKGDVPLLEQIIIDDILESNPETLPIFEKILFDRNANMAEQIEEYLTTGQTYFVVVGAGHLLGEKGIVELLRQEGYSVQQL